MTSRAPVCHTAMARLWHAGPGLGPEGRYWAPLGTNGCNIRGVVSRTHRRCLDRAKANRAKAVAPPCDVTQRIVSLTDAGEVSRVVQGFASIIGGGNDIDQRLARHVAGERTGRRRVITLPHRDRRPVRHLAETIPPGYAADLAKAMAGGPAALRAKRAHFASIIEVTALHPGSIDEAGASTLAAVVEWLDDALDLLSSPDELRSQAFLLPLLRRVASQSAWLRGSTAHTANRPDSDHGPPPGHLVTAAPHGPPAVTHDSWMTPALAA